MSVDLPQPSLVRWIQILDDFRVFTEPSPSEHVHMFLLHQLLNSIDKELNNNNNNNKSTMNLLMMQ